MKMKVLFALVVCAAVFSFTIGNAFAAVPPYVHDFDCENCHTSGSDLTSTVGNICITCHGQGSPGGVGLAHYRDIGGPIMVPSKNFAIDMSSDALGTRTIELGSMSSGPGSESSHNWNASDVNPAAGASSPSDTKFYGRQNYSGSIVSCARCHDPHGYSVDYGTTIKKNPKLLKLGAGSKDAMCVDCHRDWDTTPANALLTHPLVADYPTFLLTADPAKFKAFTPPTSEMALGVDPTSLTANSILCSTCHGTHFTDSDSSSADTPATVLVGDGRLLKATGAMGTTAAERSELCNSCHVYATHGATANQIGCLDCHSGHSYNDGTANYFVLRSDVDTAAYGAKTGLRYTSVPTNATERAAVWAGGTGVDGYCEGCHGDLTDSTVGGISEKRSHTIGEDCNNCHQHGQVSFQAQGCDQCHGYPPVENVAGGAPNAGFAVAEGGIYDYSGQTPFYNEASTKHSIHAGGGTGEYKFACAACHENNQHDPTDVLTQTFQDVFNAPANTLASAGGALTPTYDNVGGCDVVYCHSNGRTRGATLTTKTPGLWLSGPSTTCSDCHGNSTFTMTVIGTNSGAHKKHLDKGYTCNLCHTDTATAALTNDALQSDARNGDTTGPNSGKHVNGIVDVDFDGSSFTKLNTNSGVFGTDGTCQNIYCHSAGPSDTVGVIPDWDTTVTDCTSCHNDGGGNAQPATGSHAIHMSDPNGPQITLCSTCHEHDGAAGAATHVDGFIASIDYVAKCDSCHGATGGVTVGTDREPIWGTSASVDCETCHSGTAVATINGAGAPPVVEAAYNNGHGKPNVANPVDGEACILCHTAATVAGHLGGATVTRLATAYAGAAADEAFCNNCHAPENNHSTAAGTSCQTCHAPHGEANGNDAMIKSTVAGNTVTAFTTQGVRASYANAANTGICQTCHTPWNGSTGIKYFNTASNDQTHNAGNACSQCHKHDSTPTFKGAAVDCAGCHADEMASSGHAAHVQKNSLSTLIEDDLSDCVLCHGADVTDGTDPYTLTGGGNGKHQNGTADFDLGISYSNNATPADKSDDTCAGACHSSTVTDGFWTDTALNCTACHNNSGTNDGVLANAAPGADHQLHLGDGYTCDNCHDAGTAIPAAGTTTHITDIVLTETDAAILVDMGTLSAGEATVDDSSFNTGAISYVAGTKSCNNSACHNPSVASGATNNATWNVSTASCTLCHNDDVASGSPMASGSHGQHVNNAAVFGDNAACTDCHAAAATTAHRNGSLEILVGLAYTGEVAIPDSGQGTCTGSCHKDPTDPMLSPVWASVVDPATVCELCHNSPQTTGDHNGHWVSGRAALGLECQSCHFDTVNPNADPLNTMTTIKAGGKHIDGGLFDVVAGGNYNGSAVNISTFTQGNPSNCTANCHTINPKNWVTANSCEACHGDLGYVGTTHSAHVLGVTGTPGDIQADVSECVICHGADVATYTGLGGDGGSGNHQNLSVQVTSGIGTAASGCTAACHASSAADGNWADTALNCTACHNNGTNDNVIANAAPATGDHAAHVTTRGMECADCHGVLPTDTLHISGLGATGAAGVDQGATLTNKATATADNASVNDSPFNDAGNSFNDPTNSCSNTYCHDPSNNTTSAIWGVGSVSCELCHGFDRNATTTMASGSHTAHLTASDKFGTTAPESCTACHPDNSGNNGHFISTTGPTTVYQAVQFGGSVITGAQEAPAVNGMYSGAVALPTDLVYGSCGTTQCHNNGQGAAPASVGYTWATSIADDCNTCHDKRPTSNSHTFHTGITVYGPHPGGSTNCGECHNANANNTTMALKTTHINGSRDYADGNSVANHGGIFGTATTGIVGDGTVTVCNSCHGGQTAADLAKLNWVNQMAVGCESCHGDYTPASIGGATAPSRAGNAYDIDGHGKATTPASAIGGARAVNQACTDCHDNNKPHISSTALTDPNRLNIIGGKDYAVDPNGFCNACHVGVANSAVHLANTATANGNSLDGVLCTTCHDQHGQGGQDAMIASIIQSKAVSGFSDRAARASFVNAGNTGVCQVCHDPNAPDSILHFNQTSGDGELATHNAGSNCTVCHNHQDSPIFTAAGAGCSSCHGGATTGSSASNYWPDGPGNVAVGDENNAGAHVKHMTILAAKVYGQTTAQLLDDINSDTRQKALCDYCHAATTNDGDHANVANLPAEVFPAGNKKNLWNGIDADATYVSGGCNTVDCHNSQATGNGASTFGWYDGGTSTCTMCHTAGAVGSNPTSGLHTATIAQKHDQTLGAGCTECHNAMPAIDNTGAATHINGAYAIDSGINTDRGITATGNIVTFNQAAVLTEDSCAASCHADGGNWERLWSTDADSSSEVLGDPRCFVCHGYLNNFRAGMTPDHSSIAKINDGTHGNCSTCHVRPNAPYGTLSYHNTVSAFPDANVVATELIAGARAIEVNDSAGYDMVNGNCTNACHTNDPTHTVGTSAHFPANGLNGPAIDCNSCHNATGGSRDTSTVGGYTFSNIVGAHGKHANSAASAYGDDVNHSTDGGYDYGCGLCHSTTSTDHLNGTLDLKLPGNTEIVNASPAFNLDKTCSGIYCHSDGVDVAAGTSPAWTGTFTNPNGDYCQNCHGNQPTTSSHVKHVVGIHYDDIYNGTTGLLTDANATNAGHGDVTTALTINCNMCHANTLNQWRNSNNTACVACHGTETADAVTANDVDLKKSVHVNGIKDVVFAPVDPVRSKAQIRELTPGEPELDNNWQRVGGYKVDSTSHDQTKQASPLVGIWDGSNCTVACHNGNVATWGTTNVSCNACHTQLPK